METNCRKEVFSHNFRINLSSLDADVLSESPKTLRNQSCCDVFGVVASTALLEEDHILQVKAYRTVHTYSCLSFLH